MASNCARHLLKLPMPPVLIFTTAYHEHAIAAFEVHAIDYLVKPVRVQRLLAALQKVPRLRPLSGCEARAPACGGAPLPVGDRALTRRARADRGGRLSQGGAQVHHDPHCGARVSARGIADQARRGVRRSASCACTATASWRAMRSAASSAIVSAEGDAHWEVLLRGVPEALPVSRRQQFIVREIGTR